MNENWIKGSKGLAQELGVSEQTVCKWRKRGILDYATVAEIGRTLIYDRQKVTMCLNGIRRPAEASVKKNRNNRKTK